MINNTSDDSSLDDKTVVSYKQIYNPQGRLVISYMYSTCRLSHDCQDNQQIYRLAQGNDTLEIGNCASSQIQGSLCLLLSR